MNSLHLKPEMARNISLVSTALLQFFMLDKAAANYSSTLAGIELAAQVSKLGNTVIYLQLLRTLTVIASTFMTLYELYESEDAWIKATYLTAFLGSSLAGWVLGSVLGEKTANIMDTVVDNLTSVFDFAARTTASFFFNRWNWTKNWFFSSNENAQDSVGEDPIENADSNVFQEFF